MKPKYTAKIHFEDGKTAKKHGDKISKLLEWMKTESKKIFVPLMVRLLIINCIESLKIFNTVRSIQFS